MTRRVTAIAALAYLLMGQAMADDATDTAIRQCAAKSDSVERLACFDAAAAPLVEAANTATTEPSTGDIGAWQSKTETSAIDDSKTVVMSVLAKEPYPDDNTMRQPRLVIRCMESTTVMYVDFDGDYMSDIAGRGDVTLRVDKKPAAKGKMTASTDNSALGLWSGSQSIPVIKSMLGGDTLLVRAVPVSSNPVLAEFPITGLNAAIQPLRAACKW